MYTENVGEIRASMVLDSTEYSKTLETTTASTRSWSSSITNVASAAMGGALVGAAAGAAAAVASVGAAAMSVSQETAAAARDMAASMGLPTEQARHFAEVARDVYGNNFAASVGDAAEAVKEVATQLQLAAEDPALQTITQNAIALKDTFGLEVNESVNATKTLMENFGLSSTEAFDLITHGMQSGLNASDDFLDSIGEYSNQFSTVGFSADEMFSIMQTGMQEGVLGTDKISDGIKEMGLILTEGTDDAKAAFSAMGMSLDDVTAEVAAGQATWADYFPEIIAGLNAIDDPIAKRTAQVAIFGTQAEDLGVAFTESLSAATTSIEDMAGSTEMLHQRYDSFGAISSALWRELVVAASPAADKLLEIANDAMPYVIAAFDIAKETIPPIIDTIVTTIETFVDFTSELFGNDFTEGVVGGLAGFQTVKTWIDENMPLIQETVETVLGAIQAFWDSHGEAITTVVQNTLGTVSTMFETALNIILGVVKLGMQLITGDWQGAGETFVQIARDYWDGISTIFSLQLNSLGAVVDSLTGGMLTRWREWGTSVKDSVSTAYQGMVTGTQTRLQEMGQNLANLLGQQKNTTDQHTNSVLQGWQNMYASLSTNTQSAWQTISQNTQSTLSNMSATLQSNVQQFQASWMNNFSQMQNTSQSSWQTIGNFAMSGMQTVLQAIQGTNLYNAAYNALQGVHNAIQGIDWWGMGSSIIQGIAQGVQSGAGALANSVQQAAQNALNEAKSWLGINSPSTRAMQEVGEPTGEGFIVGTVDKVRTMAPKMARDVGEFMMNVNTRQPTAQPALAGAFAGGGGTARLSAPITIEVHNHFNGNVANGQVERETKQGVLGALRSAGMVT